MALAALLCGCASATFEETARDRSVSLPHFERALNTALSWPAPSDEDELRGGRLVEDGAPVSYPEIAVARAILRANPRMTPAGALILATTTARAARANALPVEFLAATLLQESAFDPQAISSAGAVGIAQFTIGTAEDNGVNPFDPFDAIDGAARLLGIYYRAYRPIYTDPYAATLAAYNAGPGAVARYRGVPPYAETREYVSLIYDRWAHIASFERASRESSGPRGRAAR